jgi:hypothetical protein
MFEKVRHKTVWQKNLQECAKNVYKSALKMFAKVNQKSLQKCAKMQRYTYRVLQTIQMKLILLCVWAEPAFSGSTKTDLKFKYEISIGQHTYNSMYVAGCKVEK